ncbi:uncharacterized protein Z518_06319 [Rhinocladiella mackenziei CBS 650.93]|uniref:Rhinocladiella mackenziei CBS 650.93 unplaced genomic scaffold supercont1.4, whole genome shotgun sequence n=1 Tax=Rhinocladiella mackenziei CBS 650.93 TaxID=1442369 RepID=A0A0D2FTN6_9EURO|nr:uncharacterized protein Z518_06319 [Rhinocladiella mackenziei CBS 650.93]KIX05447.1 hypothetical protein Z518_06319 [Rhinocladiella mackenziei CBS 650.93]
MRYRTWTSSSPAPVFEHGGRLWSRQDATNTCLPQSLISIVPDCAVTCIQSFASANYPGSTCANTSDLNYLCTVENTSSLTIGEGSLQCIVSFCTGQDQQDLGVYSICNGIPGAQPETARTITATIIGTSTSTSSTMENLPTTVGNPTSTQQVSTIVMATEVPSGTPVTTPSLSLPSSTASSRSSSSTSIGPQGTLGAIASPNEASSKRGLTTAQIVGIAIGGAVTALIVLALLMLMLRLCKRRRERRRGQKRSRLVEPTPPPTYQSPQETISPTFGDMGSSMTVPNTYDRFYAPQQSTEEKRRSFWRRSIRPEEIGIAVSPKAPGESSPVSISSQHSISRLLPTAPSQTLWPAPLDLETTRERKRHTLRPLSDATMFDEEPETRVPDSEPIYVNNQPFVLEKPPRAKRRGLPPPLTLPVVPENPPRTSSRAARIPLTPTYDNGNIDLVSPPRSFGSPPSTVPSKGETQQVGRQAPFAIPEHRLAPSSIYANRNVLRKKPPPRLPLRAGDRQPVEPLTQPRDPPAPPAAAMAPSLERQNSVTSVYTEIEEDTTPEEINKQLGLRANPPTPSIISVEARRAFDGQESPIRDLRYPQIPRSAAVSRQAEKPAQLRTSFLRAPSSKLRPTRDQLARAGASFMQTDTTSSDGYMSDETIEWPVPPLSDTSSRKGTIMGQSSLKSNMAKLRNNPASGNRRAPAQFFSPSLNELLTPETKTVMVSAPQRSPSSKARLTPNKSSSGDLYLTVEI